MFYCTAGRGTEIFVSEELTYRRIDDQATVTDGKVYFKCDSKSYAALHKLKSVERVFAQIDTFNAGVLSQTGKYQFLRSLKERLLTRDKLNCAWDLYRGVNQVWSIRSGTKGQTQTSSETESSLDDASSETDLETREPSQKKARVEDGDTSSGCPGFRVSCKIAGRWRRAFQARNFQELAQELGRDIVRKAGWRVELKHPEVEVCVHVNDEFVTAGIPLSRYPISKRDYIIQPGLRSTVAWILGHLANIQAVDVVLDPMCGKGTILIEAAHENMMGHFIGSDVNLDQLHSAVDNRAAADLENRISLNQADVLHMPFRDSCIDKVVCDAPFGQKHTITGVEINVFYTHLLQQITRVLKLGGLAVLMTSVDLKSTVLGSITESYRQSASVQSDTSTGAEAEKTVYNETANKTNAKEETGDCQFSKDDNVATQDEMKCQNKNRVESTMKSSCHVTGKTQSFQPEMSVSHDACASHMKGESHLANPTLPEIMTGDVQNKISEEKSKKSAHVFTPSADSISWKDSAKERRQQVSQTLEPGAKETSEIDQAVTTLKDVDTGKDSTQEEMVGVQRLVVMKEYYVKLGETHACIFVLEKK